VAISGYLDSKHQLVLRANEPASSENVIALCYYRAGYCPEDYPSEKEWEARLLIERSLAIKCPSIAYHLIGTKKMQQVLALPGNLERFLADDQERISRIRESFVGLYSLDETDPSISETIQSALADPSKFVMKPQREGGGNNLYEKQISEALLKFSPEKRSTYILMDRIMVPSFPTYFLRNGNIIQNSGASELGIFSLFIHDGTNVVMNESSGYLLRTKIASVDDGGVAAGVAVLDSPYLFE